MRLRHSLHAFDTPVLLTECTKQTGLSHQKTQGTRMNAHTFQRGTGITHHAQDRRSTLIRSIAALAAVAVAGAAHASTISGTVNTGASRTAKSSQSAADAAAIPFRQIADLILVVQGEEPLRGWAHRGFSTPTHQRARFSKVEIIIS